MFENLLNLVQENAGDAIVNNNAIPNEHNQEAMSLASSSIMDGLKNALSGGGNISDLVSMFSDSNNVHASPVTQNIQSGFIQNLMQKFGLDSGAASGIAATLIPMVLQKLVSRTNDPNDNGFNIQDMLGNLGGGGSGGLDIGSLVQQFTGGGNNHQQSGGGGIMDTISNLFK